MTLKICYAVFQRDENTLENPMSCRCSKTNSSVFHFHLHHKFTVKQFFRAISVGKKLKILSFNTDSNAILNSFSSNLYPVQKLYRTARTNRIHAFKNVLLK